MKHSLLLAVCASVVVSMLVLATKTDAVSSAFAVLACTTSTACAGGNNTGTGPGVLGQSKASHGVIGNTTFNSTGPSNGESAVLGQDLSTSGVYDVGVQGISVRGYGVRGRSTSNSGVRGDSTNQYGVVGTGVYGVVGTGGPIGVVGSGIYGGELTGSSEGLFASGNGNGITASSSGGDGIDVSTTATGKWAITATEKNGSGVLVTGGGRGGDFTGGYAGIVGRSDSFPIFATNADGSATVFYVDASGNVHYKGSLIQMAAANGVPVAASYTRATSPAVEETGTARLAFGSATVYFSPAFARSIDPRLGYQVFLTPGADTRGLFVAGKYAGGFTVREVQGGRGTFSFDYHVYARTAQPVTPAANTVPSVPAVQPPTIRQPPNAALPPVRP